MFRVERPCAETMPLVTVCPTPKGLPMAKTKSPTSSVSLDFRFAKGMVLFSASAIRKTARSDASSCSLRSALNSRPSFKTTLISTASLMTCALVMTIPSLDTITPEPSEFSTCWRMRPKMRSSINIEKNGSLKKGLRVRTVTSRLA